VNPLSYGGPTTLMVAFVQMYGNNIPIILQLMFPFPRFDSWSIVQLPHICGIPWDPWIAPPSSSGRLDAML